MTVTQEIKVWEHSPVPFSVIREKLMTFCYENKCAPDEVMIAPYTESDHGTIIQMGIRFSIEKEEEA